MEKYGKSRPGSVADTLRRLTTGGGVPITGLIVQEDDEAISLQIGDSIFDIRHEDVLTRSDREGDGDHKAVDLVVGADAQLIQRIAAPAINAALAGLPAVAADACNCACACQCSGGGGGGSIVEQAFRQQAFRNFYYGRF
ncbi:hypothetical protein BH10PSE13_BH10PSE13_20640 [soil metagenome]